MSASNAIVVAADFTADPVVDTLDFWRNQFGWDDEIRLAPYNQVIQTLLDPSGAFGNGAFGNQAGCNVILLREARLQGEFAEQFSSAIDRYWARGSAPLLIALCPSAPNAGPAAEPAAGPTAGPPAHSEVPERDSVYVIPSAEVQRLYPVPEVFDEHAETLGDVPYTRMFFAAVGTAVARRIHAIRMRPYKVIALDCDNTLWRGTCGEDGPEGVVVDEPRKYLQSFMRDRRDAGMLLALASKNNRDDVLQTFQAHPEMPLRWDDFVIDAIDWHSKGLSFSGMAQRLNLGLDSFAFVDDSAKEIGEVQAAHPEVLGLALPHDDEEIPRFLDHVWAFDRHRLTQEDLQRNQSYREQVNRAELERTTGSLADFIEQLHVQIHVQPLHSDQVARVAQLTQRTNQMNTAPVRRSEAEVARMLNQNPPLCLTTDVTDRFGSYGLVGATFLSYSAGAVRVDNMLLSCRALGRGVEREMLRDVGKIAVGLEKQWVEVAFNEGPRNRPAREFLFSLPEAEHTSLADGLDIFRLSAAVCAQLVYQPEARVPNADVQQERAKPKSPSPPQGFQDYARIARDLSSPAQILHAIDEIKRQRHQNNATDQPPLTGPEQEVADLWAEVLHIPSPGRDDDFFDLGGHSLLAVQLLSRVREAFGVELSLDLVYTGKLTVANMAAAVELARADPAEIDRLLAEIDSLSEEEMRALLESEGA